MWVGVSGVYSFSYHLTLGVVLVEMSASPIARDETGKGGDFLIYSNVKTDQTYEGIDLP